MEGAVNELVGDDEVRRLVFFLEGADGGDRDDALDAELLHAVDVGAEVELRRQDAVAATVAREKTQRAGLPIRPGRRGLMGRQRGVESFL